MSDDDNKVVHLRIVEKPEGGPHITGEAICAACKATWVCVAPVGTSELECPECFAMRGHYIYEIGWEDSDIYICGACDGFIYKVLKSGVLCLGCGTEITFEQLAESDDPPPLLPTG